MHRINKFDLEGRAVQFALLIIEISEQLPSNRPGNHIANQLLRSGTSVAFNYGEAQVAESRNDFIHKMKICLKELKETHVALQIIKNKPLVKDLIKTEGAMQECRELIAIFAKSIDTARKGASHKVQTK